MNRGDKRARHGAEWSDWQAAILPDAARHDMPISLASQPFMV
ncbi:hypothetical protein BN2497_2259 [Janthinobacterium sp. CG23_2]|nr:hypothetical protein BN2497_2259 [Janthinobacterium sp. CG23_2]CUU27527.1 hypothetical protein BN3177_2259 [Janthinobacterium sp. CG23_2]